MENENTIGGYAVDATVMYGPSHGSSRPAGGGPERGVVTEHPLYGAVDPKGGSLPSVRQFVSSPVGITLILLVGGFYAWKSVFG